MPKAKPGAATPKEQTQPKIGRPSDFTQAFADAFCELIGSSTPAVRALEKLKETATYPVPSWTTVKRWLQDDEGFRAQYVRAREDSADTDADEMREINRRVIGPWGAGEKPLGAQEAKVALDTLKWFAARRKPKVYGSDLDLGDDGGSIHLTIVRHGKEGK